MIDPPRGSASVEHPSFLAPVLHHPASDTNNLSWRPLFFDPTTQSDPHSHILLEDSDECFMARNDWIQHHHMIWLLNRQRNRQRNQSRSVPPRETDSVEGSAYPGHRLVSEENTPVIDPESPLGVALSNLQVTLEFVDLYFPPPPTPSSAALSTALTVGEGVSGPIGTLGIQPDP